MKDLIKDAIEQYHQNTCIKFKIRTNEPDYVNIFAGRGCYSTSIGKKKYGGRQDVSLGLGCGFIGTVVHELGHAIGLSHEHSRSDRDLHITVYKNNIDPNRIGQFNITDPKIEFKTTRYNCESIMHYGEYAFSIKPQVLKSMEAKDGKTKLLEPYDKAGLTNTDIQMVKDLYDCK
ncbi:Astacin-like metalloprotease toxin 1 [Argiope bruennichi]|uniref:Metalloendopeptidase n=1 Tax=Argiope bruennichi TaxID=94029 RepID=A0A8T0FQT1_ARGBR|nr:Astacin-like metalloprotease toxin 1 [Argiope bruennichi]